MGAGPSLQLLYDNKERAQHWGDWLEIRPDICEPILKTIKPRYSLRFNPKLKGKLQSQGEIIATARDRGNSMTEFLLLFEEHGGKEVFLFGFDGDSSGYWREDEDPSSIIKQDGDGILLPEKIKKLHSKDRVWFNEMFLPVTSLKIYHIGHTLLDVPMISVDEVEGQIGRGILN